MGLQRFFGGLTLPAMTPAPAPVRCLPLPARLRVPLLQHAGVEAEPCVGVGERVARFQCLGRVPPDSLGAAVHSPAAGVVVGFERGPVALPGLPEALHVLIDVGSGVAGHSADGTFPEIRLPPLSPHDAPLGELRARMAEAGIVGPGGVGWPSAEKLVAGRRLLILNSLECEPVIASDEALLREHADDVLAGGRMLARLCGATRIVLAVGQGMRSALAAVRESLQRENTTAGIHSGRIIELQPMPNRYPAVSERQLILALTGEDVPDDGFPDDLSVLVQNIGTAFAALRAVRDGEPLVSRFVTVGGNGMDNAAVFDVAIGTPASALGDALGGWREDAVVLRAGGPMMGVALPDDSIAVAKNTSAITAWCALSTPNSTTNHAQPCIRCGDCATVCPSRLQPQLLHARLQGGDAKAAWSLGLGACIECGACDAVCPSAIPLTAEFGLAQSLERLSMHKRQKADAARQRFERRIERLRKAADDAASTQASRVIRSSGAAAAALLKARAKRDS